MLTSHCFGRLITLDWPSLYRIREEGLFIMGIGRSHTPAAFVQACASFTYAEILVSSTTKNVNKRTTTKKSSPAGEVVLRNVTADTTTMTTDTAAPADVNPVKDKTPGNRDIDLDLVKRAFPIAANVDTGRVYFGTLAIELRKLDSTFDVRNFGFSNFRQFCEGALAKVISFFLRHYCCQDKLSNSCRCCVKSDL